MKNNILETVYCFRKILQRSGENSPTPTGSAESKNFTNKEFLTKGEPVELRATSWRTLVIK